MSRRLDLYLIVPASLTTDQRHACYDRMCDLVAPVMQEHGGNLTLIVTHDITEGDEWGKMPFLLAEGSLMQSSHSWASPADLQPRDRKTVKRRIAPTVDPDTSIPPARRVAVPDLLTCVSGHDGRHLVSALSKGVIKCFHCGRAWTGADAARVWNSSPHDGVDGVQ